MLARSDEEAGIAWAVLTLMDASLHSNTFVADPDQPIPGKLMASEV